MNDVTFYDLMGENFDIWIKKNRVFGYDLMIEDECRNLVVEEYGVHRAAMDSFADFCREFLVEYERVCDEEE